MPAKSRSEQRLFQAAEHGATFPKATQLRDSLTHQQLHDFASGPETGKPAHVKQAGTDTRHSRHLQQMANQMRRKK